MVLPSTGNTISFNQIRIELGISSQAPFSIETAENGGYVALNKCAVPQPSPTNPASISEWWSYDNSAVSTEIGLMDSSTVSCADVCSQPVDGDTILYWNTGQTTVYTDTTCNTLAPVGSYADLSRINCYTILSAGTLYSTTNC
jgi:hypothetical protein